MSKSIRTEIEEKFGNKLTYPQINEICQLLAERLEKCENYDIVDNVDQLIKELKGEDE
jgi:hypothetical protein